MLALLDQRRRRALGGGRRDALPDDAGGARDADAGLPGALLRAGVRPARPADGLDRGRRDAQPAHVRARGRAEHARRATRCTSRSPSASRSRSSSASRSGRCAACARPRRRARSGSARRGSGTVAPCPSPLPRSLEPCRSRLSGRGSGSGRRTLAPSPWHGHALEDAGRGILGRRGPGGTRRRLPLRPRRRRRLAGPVLALAARGRARPVSHPGHGRVRDRRRTGALPRRARPLRAPRRHVLDGGQRSTASSRAWPLCASSASPRSS